MGKWRWILIPLIVLFMIIYALSFNSAEEDFTREGMERGVAFLSGGVGHREREILKEMGKEYSLKLVFSDKKGEYLSNLIVKIINREGETILTTISNGPWLFVDLPSGIYQLEASYQAERKRISQFKIGGSGQKVLSLQW